MKKINVAIIGVGSFAKALVEGVSFYTKNPDDTTGLINPHIGNYQVKDINFVVAFDVDKRKVGKKLYEAISKGSNVTKQITSSVKYDAIVYRGPTLDGVVKQMRDTFVQESDSPVVNVVNILKKHRVDVVINLVPSGSDQATYMYADAALQAGCSFINCIPTPMATIPAWRKKFEKKKLVLLGDDTKSQLGATMLNRLLLEVCKMRGIKVTKSDQENRGGNADHFNLLYRAETKEKSKREALTKYLEKDVKPTVSFHYTGKPSGHKIVNLTIEGEMFGRTPIHITSIIEDEISINGAGTVVDAIRIAKLLVDKNKQKEAKNVCAFLMKSPPQRMSDQEAFIAFNKLLDTI